VFQFDEKLGNGAYKDVYLAYDTETGKEVAWYVQRRFREEQGCLWCACGTSAHASCAFCLSRVCRNTVEMRRLPANEKRRIRSETEILAELQHPHIINFYHVWEQKEKDQICFTTEIVTSGTLKQYTSRVKSIKLKVIKKW
jgi:serine/threonine protein kinase